jgi:hypothetical protein
MTTMVPIPIKMALPSFAPNDAVLAVRHGRL